MRNWMCRAGWPALLSVLFLTQPVCIDTALAEGTKTAKTSKKKTKAMGTAAPEATPTPMPAGQTASPNSSSSDFQSPLKSPGARDVKMNSVRADLDVSESLYAPSKEQLLREKNPTEFLGGNTSVVQSVQVGQSKKKFAGLKMGTFRSEGLTEGYVAPPGITDFAAYFRASSPALRAKVASGAASEPTRPGSMSNEELQRQAVAEQLRTQTVESIKQILAQKPSVDQKIDLMMRMAEIQVERHTYALELEIKSFNESHDRWMESQKGSEPVFRTDKSEKQLLSAVDYLRQIVNGYPNHQRTPEALFTLGFLLAQIRSDSAEIYFDRLVKRYPNSDFVPDGYLALGEFYFSKLKFEKALESYLKIVDSYREKSPRAYDYAVYKIGWTWFNKRSGGEAVVQKNLSKALAAFKLVVKRSDEFPAEKTLKDLRRDALKDMILVFVDLGDVAGAQSYYEGLNEPELYLTMLERLAWQYSENGEYDKSVGIYQRILQEAAMNPRLPQLYTKLPDLYAKQGQYDKLVAVLQQMSQTLALQGPWAKKFGGSTDAMALREKTLATELRGWAEKLHSDAQKGRGDKRYDDALAVYSIFLENFGDRAESYSSHFYRSEILARRGRFLEAADGYVRAADLDARLGIRGKYTNDALVNAIACIDRVLEKAPPPQLPEPGKAQDKIPLTALHDKLVRAIDQFVKMFPADEQVLEFSHRAARTVYAFGDYQNARARWVQLAQRFPKSKEVFDGLRLVLKVHVDRKDWDSAIADSRQFVAIPGVRDTKLGADVYEVLKASMFSKAMVLEQKEQRQAASDLYLQYHREFQDDSEAPKALFNAANNRFKMGKIDEAISTLRILLAQYPKSGLVQNAHYLIASSYDALGRFGESAASYETLARDYPKNPVAVDSLLRAAEERMATMEYELAIRNANEFIARFSNHTSVGLAWMIVGRANLKLNNRLEATKAFSHGAEALQGSQPGFALQLYGLAAEAAYKNGDKAKAAQLCDAGVALWGRLGDKAKSGLASEGIRLVAQTKFDLLDERLPALTSRVITDGVQLVPQFKRISDDAVVMSKSYEAIVRLGNAEAGLAALYRIAEVQEFLANALMNAPAPAGAKPEEVEEFKSNVEKFAVERQDEATKLYYTAWQKGNETEAITPFMRKLHDKLMVLKPQEFRRVTSEMPAPVYFSSEIVVAPETSKITR